MVKLSAAFLRLFFSSPVVIHCSAAFLRLFPEPEAIRCKGLDAMALHAQLRLAAVLLVTSCQVRT